MSLELYQSHMKSLTLAVAVTALLLSVNASVFALMSQKDLQSTCPACSVKDSVIFTITFSLASSFATMSMLATHYLVHREREIKLAHRLSVLAC